MSIDRLGPAGSLIAALRTERKERALRGDGAPVAGKTSTPERSSRDVEALRRQLAGIVHGVRIGDAEAMRTARAEVVRAVLLWEFGSELREHGEWREMLDSISRAIEVDASLIKQFDQFVDELQRNL